MITPFIRSWVAAGTALFLAGCLIVPDFRAPAPPTTNSYTAVPLPKMTT
ncbi:MAG: hypothetical protein GXP51_12475, partial [Deltaproteobacteria bacterium]|nr:hypothetical protein [Deltaproteobacteria bacterium]